MYILANHADVELRSEIRISRQQFREMKMSCALLFSFNRQKVTMGPTFPFLCKNRHRLLFLTIEFLHFAQLTHMIRYYFFVAKII